jgi:cytidylate kinase
MEEEALMREEPRTTITISRQMGSGGSYVGYLVAKELGFRYVDREILRLAAEHLGTDTSVLESHDGRTCGLIDNLVRAFSFGTPETAYVPSLNRPVYDKDLFTLESKIMNEIADQYNAVIAGRAGFHVLRGRPSVIHIFIHAPLEFRIQRVMQVQHITDAREARTKVEEADRARSKFVRDMVGVDWNDARNFHLCIDAGAVGFHTSAEMIIKLVGEKRRQGGGKP